MAHGTLPQPVGMECGPECPPCVSVGFLPVEDGGIFHFQISSELYQ